SDYTKSGYDRGHLLPSADRSSSVEVNKTTFYMSNVAPQLPSLNRGVWKSLEEQVREWAKSADTVFVVVGAILQEQNTPKTIGRDVTVPEKFFKAIMIKKEGDKNKIHCYIMPNSEELNKNFDTYSVSLEELEKNSNIDLIWNNQKN
ncbi:MAG: DNA/RNA non-specific endonuclease, partial [Rikenellaceae bacterium]